ncbi:MAG: glutamyl-tRNA reductase [Actinomycetota bacterium]
MTLLVVGVSHRSASLPLLERVALDMTAAERLRTIASGKQVNEVMVLATCNRVEVYADVTGFHAGLTRIARALSDVTSVPLDDLAGHLVVRYAERAVEHVFAVSCGLESMAVGEGQVLGQLRRAWQDAQRTGHTGRRLDDLLRSAMRVGKSARAETALEAANASLVDVGFEHAERVLGPLTGQHVLVVGAGSMSGLVVTTAARVGVRSMSIANRTISAAARLATQVGGQVVLWDDLPSALSAADLIITCTGAAGTVIDELTVRAAIERRTSDQRQVYIDLALPRDVAPEVSAITSVDVVDLAVLGAALASSKPGVDDDLTQVKTMIAAAVAEHNAATQAQAVTPAVVALRSRAAEFVDREMKRLATRLPDASADVLTEARQAMNRVVEKLLHAPTVRVQELAGRPDGNATSYAVALRELFDLAIDTEASTPARLGEDADAGELLHPALAHHAALLSEPTFLAEDSLPTQQNTSPYRSEFVL